MRKRLVFIILTSVLMACISCNKQESSMLMPQLKDYPVSVTTKDSDTYTKVTLKGHDFTWSQGDKLNMLAVASSGANATAELTLNDIDAGFASGRFAGTVSINAEPNKCYFAYPSSTTLAYSGSSAKATYSYDGQSGALSPFLYGSSAYRTEGITCQLHHIGGMLHITFPVGIQTITVQGNNGESVTTAVCDLSLATPTYTVSGATSFLVSIADYATECYITMPPVNFTKGFSLIFTDTKGVKMYKSFNFDKACDFSSTYSGTIIPINIDSFIGYAFSTNVACGHKIESGILTGTNVTISNPAYQGIPSKLISSWGIEITQKDSVEIIASKSFTKAELSSSSLPISTKYLTKGAYTSHPYIILTDGTRLPGNEVTFQTTPPSGLAITTKVTTSYSYYPSNITKANSLDGSTVYIEQCSINISPEVLAKAGATATYTYDGTSTSTTFSGSSLTAPNKTSQAWSPHTFSASVTFDGLTINSSSTTVQVTGLPYTANPPSINNSWTAGDYTSFENSYMRMGEPIGGWQTGKSYATSPTWNIPADINISISILYSSKTTRSKSHTLSAALYNGSSESDVLVSDEQQSVTNKTIQNNDKGTLSSSYNRVRFTNSSTVVGRYCDIYKVTLTYR